MLMTCHFFAMNCSVALVLPMAMAELGDAEMGVLLILDSSLPLGGCSLHPTKNSTDTKSTALLFNP